MTVVRIDDPDDERVADFVRLTDPDLRRLRSSTDGAEGEFFIAEGVGVIRSLLRSTYTVRSLFLTPARWASLEADVGRAGVDGAPVFVAEQAVLNHVAGFSLHRGALASADRPCLPTVDAVCSAANLVVVTEGLNDHENLGALFRNAAAFGVDAILLDPTSCDPLYRRAVRVSMGHVLHVPFTRIAPGAAGVAHLRRLGFEVLALTPAAGALDLRRLPAPTGPRALLLGAEGPGLIDETLAAADVRVRIPMVPGVDSLNVAAATAVALHELRRHDLT